MVDAKETAAKDAAAKKRAMLDALIPGRTVPLLDGNQKPFADAIVYPLGVRQIRRFGTGIMSVFRVLIPAQAVAVAGAPPPVVDEKRLMEQAGPLVLAMLPDLLAECVRIEPEGTDITLDDLPHWCLAPIARAWVEESFGGGRWRPWKQAFEGLSEALATEATRTSSPASAS